MKTVCSVVLLLMTSISAWSAHVDTVVVRSLIMKKDIKAVVITPKNYSKDRKYPVTYLLHGYSGNYANWINSAGALRQASDLSDMIIVCPDGGYSSWYWDSPVNDSFKYETYISKELVLWVDKHYSTVAKREGRAITGLSMGGHGALYLAFKHQDIFGAAGSMSGGVDIRPFPENWDMAARLGSYAAHPERWEQHTVINMLHLLTPGSLSLIIDCGIDDFFYGVNESLHKKLLERDIPHDYITRPGRHDWNYWNNAVLYQLLYFNQYFTAKR